MSHRIGWVEDEMCGVTWCNGTALGAGVIINIYDWVECPACGKQLKLRQINEVLEQ